MSVAWVNGSSCTSVSLLALWAAALRVELLVLLLRVCALVLGLWAAVRRVVALALLRK